MLRSATLARQAGRSLDGLRTWVTNIEAKSNHNKAACAMANKLARICYACLRDGMFFDALSGRPSNKLERTATLAFQIPSALAGSQIPVTITAIGPTESAPVTRSKTVTLDVLPAGTTSVSGRVLHAEDEQKSRVKVMSCRARTGEAELQMSARSSRWGSRGATARLRF